VVSQQADPEFHQKSAAGVEALRDKVEGMSVTITELRTAR